MSKPAVVFADPEAELIEYLTLAWAARAEPYSPGRVSTSFPVSTLTPGETTIQVELEGGNADDYPVTERAQVRIVCHAPPLERSNVKDLASITQALLHQHPGSAHVAGVFIRSARSNVITDPDTGNLMVWFLVRVPMLAIRLT